MFGTEVAHPDASRQHRGDHFERRLEMLCLAARSPTADKCFFSVLCELLDSETRCRILAKDLARADIAPQSRNRLVPRLTHNDELADAIHRRLGDASGAEGVAAELLDLQSRPAGCALQELADGIPVQAAPRNMTVSLNGPEDRAFSNRGPVEPLAKRADRARILTGTEGQTHFPSGAFLVCLRFADGDDDAVG
jgi:hypothetical protein